MWVEIDFKGLLPQTAKPAVWIWHDAADDCGSLCDANVDFLKQVAATQVKHGGKTKMVVRPRFIFQPCSEKGTEQQCAETCTDNQKCALARSCPSLTIACASSRTPQVGGSPGFGMLPPAASRSPALAQ